MRFEDAEAQGRNPWAATARRINATKKPAKLEGIRLFLSELLVERPDQEADTLDLLVQLGAVPEHVEAAPPSTGNAFLDKMASFDRLDEGSPRSSPPPKPLPGGESPMASVLLAKKWTGREDPTCFWISEKLDGVRAIWDGSSFWSRTGKPFNAPQWFKDSLPDVVLDGELFAGRGLFRDTISAVRRKVPRDSQWRNITYMVFDAPQAPGAFEARMRYLDKHVGGPHAQVVPQLACGSPAELARIHRDLGRKGAEGLMLRRRGSRYEAKRSSTLFKLKDFHDSEARITGYQKGEGKHRGRLGAYHAALVATEVRFKVGTGLTDAHREDPLPIGAIITVRYQELTPDGVPRFPVFIAARDYE